MYRKSAKICVKNVHFLNVRVKKYSRSGDSYVLQCILLKTFVCLMFAVLAIRELFLTVNFCRFTVCVQYLHSAWFLDCRTSILVLTHMSDMTHPLHASSCW